MTPAVSTAAGPSPARAEQDAGGRLELVQQNVPNGSNGQWLAQRLTSRSVDVPLPRSAQDLSTVSALTTDRGAARTEAGLSMASRAQGFAQLAVPHRPPRREVYLALQEWEGTVLDRTEDSIRVRLFDKTTQGPDEVAEIPLEEISPQDRNLIKAGSVFYWSIGYLDSQAGQRARQSLIVFRRLPAWTDSELRDVKRKVRRQKALFGWA